MSAVTPQTDNESWLLGQAADRARARHRAADCMRPIGDGLRKVRALGDREAFETFCPVASDPLTVKIYRARRVCVRARARARACVQRVN